ncbi:M23 family metallopeptidase [Geoalkalibacter halelectricus]|uniref:M23 family metallopeptidase n=1 Tax=Geoalkalibacter halelectricus TaxID=2847045 RepID=A0ABY5ZQG1_9BACT|nr:M23 family metallopeptidase [Geoalkalibacter halelectricus]MDO3376715.1 M23 family metallopeptidase [Geoalkalibacter halelectricus]UWZ81333.1 M23 family metallopeptidase [Geoalkalibacter halelectricus]
MAARKFTVLVIPEGSHQVRRLVLRLWTLRLVAAVLVVLCGALGYLSWELMRTRVDYAELAQLRQANFAQDRELQVLAQRLHDLRQELVVLAQNDAKVRVMAKLTKPRNDSPGVGGPLESPGWGEVSDLQRQIDQVRAAIEARRLSQEEIQGFLNDQRSFSAAKPSGWPARGWVSSGFGMRNSPFSGRRKMHEGMDIAARTGTPIHATADGIVSRSETVAGYGKLVVIDHGYGYQTYYAHNSRNLVRVGERVQRGQKIAEVGSTGSSTGPHVHYEVRLNNVPLNPRNFL